MQYRIYGESGEIYSVDAAGSIGRPAMDMAPSDSWKALALIHRSNGRTVIPFSEWTDERLSSMNWTFKNGKPRYALRDWDHGFVREWGEGVMRIVRV